MEYRSAYFSTSAGIAANASTALRSGGERETNVSDSTKLTKRE